MKLFHWLVTLPLVVLLTDFAIWNGSTATLSFWPLPFTLETRVFLIVFVPLLIGFFFGELAAWFSGRSSRRAARRHEHRIEELERELAAKLPPKEPTKEIARN